MLGVPERVWPGGGTVRRVEPEDDETVPKPKLTSGRWKLLQRQADDERLIEEGRRRERKAIDIAEAVLAFDRRQAAAKLREVKP